MVDVTFDCREDACGRDPDSHSPTLRRYHQYLWSKPLPNGKFFHLDISSRKPFLVHRSDLGEFFLTSDSITHRYASRARIQPFVQQLSPDQKSFAECESWLVSECIIFPGNKIDGKVTINGARGMSGKIGDRFDLTLECVRRHYRGEESPLSEVLQRYAPFCELFESFRGYVDFFLLQDLVNADYTAVNFYLPFNDFKDHPLPKDLESYASYLSKVENFIIARANRILKWCAERSASNGLSSPVPPDYL